MRAYLLVLVAAVTSFAQDASPEKLIEVGHWKRARTLVERKLQETPDDANATFLLSQIRAAFGDRTAPSDLAEKAVRLDGKVARYHRQLAEIQGLLAQRANVFQQIGLARRFRKEIDTAIEQDPRDVQALRDLLEFYLRAPGIVGGDIKKAESTAQQVAALDQCEGFLAKARIAEFRKDLGEAEGALRRGAEVCPSSYKTLTTAAEFLVANHRDESKAEALANAALALDRDRVDAWSTLATIYAGRAELHELEALLAGAAEAVPDDPTPYYRAAERLITDGRDTARAERYLRTYLVQDAEGNQPTAADAHWKLGLALRVQGHEADAVREWRIAVQLDPESPAARELKRTRNGGSTSNTTRTGGGN